VVAAAPGERGWGQSINEIKELQRAWKDVGFVPRRDADAVYSAFRAACDALFQKRDAARDAEANAHRAEIDALRAEIDAVIAGGDDPVARAIAARTRARELGVLAAEVGAMVSHVIASHGDAVRGSELDPAQLRARREKLIARAVELLPKAPAAPEAGVDLAAQLKNAMRQNAFGELRFSGRDPVEVVDELRASWAESGPLVGDEDREQQARFDATVQRVLDAAGAASRPPRDAASSDDDARSGRRRRDRRDRRGGDASDAPTGDAAVVAGVVAGVASGVPAAILTSPHDAITRPVVVPAPEVAEAAGVPADDADASWDLGDDDPTAGGEPESRDDKPAVTSPSATEMAGDGAVEGDGIDTGWD
jgi:hypothetical protein